LRVVVVVLLLLARPRCSTLGRSLVVLAAALSVVSLRGTVRLDGARILQTLRIVVVLLLANEGLLAFGASGVVLSATLAVESLGWTICGNFAVRLRRRFAG
jgi:hypothetical protein